MTTLAGPATADAHDTTAGYPVVPTPQAQLTVTDHREARRLARDYPDVVAPMLAYYLGAGAHTDDPVDAHHDSAIAGRYQQAAVLLARPLHGPEAGVACTWGECDPRDGWARWRVFCDLDYRHTTESGIDHEVCETCRPSALDHLEDAEFRVGDVELEPMTPADYARHGITVVGEPSEWDTAAPLLTVDFGDDALDLGQLKQLGGAA